MNLKELYNKLPTEITVFIEYILPSVIIGASINYLAELKLDNVYSAMIVNIVLIFLRQVKPRYERLKK